MKVKTLSKLAIPALLLAPAAAAQEGAAPSPRQDAVHELLVSRNPLIAEGDAHYRRRQEGRAGPRASSREISKAVAAYERAAQADPDGVEARWKLARALYFEAIYAERAPAARRGLLEKARRVSEEAIEILARRSRARGAKAFAGLPPRQKAAALGSVRDAAPAFFWAAVAWGEWALAIGKWQAARTGAAEKVRDYAETVVALAPTFEEGGGYRILGRLHDQAPSIPFVTGWVSRETALRNLRLAVRTAPRNFVNRHFLSEALAGGSRAERAEAVRIARKLVADAPSPLHLVEELKIQEDARRNLKQWSGRG